MAFHGLVKDSVTLAVARKVARGPRKRRRKVARPSVGQSPEVRATLRETEGLTFREAMAYAAAKGRAQSDAAWGKR